MLVTGEPGIGKTSVAAELSRAAHDDGALVLYGAPDEEPLIAYQPFVEALRPWVTHVPEDELRERTRALGGDLARLLPELRQRLPELPEPPQMDPEAERYRLFRAVASLLADVSRGAPVVLVLDDLHWADESSLLLLKHVVRSSTDSALLILGTSRDSDPRRAGALADLIADLRRDRLLARLRLAGLAADEVAALVSERGGDHAAPAGFGGALQRETEGNPFFIGEVLLHLAGSELAARPEAWVEALESGSLGVPQGVKEVTGRRLARLDEHSRDLLEVASVVGMAFSVDLLERLSDLPEGEFVDALDEAAAAQLVNELPGEVGGYAFSHALIRATLYDGLGAIRRARLHGRVGVALEELHAGHLEPYLGELAHHFLETAGAGNADKAVDYSRRAGDRASSQFAHTEAAGYYERALTALERAGKVDEPRGRDILLSMVETGSVLGIVGELSRADELLGQVAAAAAGFHRDVALHARVERDHVGYWMHPEVDLDGHTRLAKEAIVELDGLGHDLGLASAWSLFAEVPWTRCRMGEASAALERALTHARAAGDQRIEARILDELAVSYVFGPMPVSEAIARCERMIEEAGSRNLWHLVIFISMGVLRAMRGEFDMARELFRRGAGALEELGLERERALQGELGGEIEFLAGDPVAAERELGLDRLRETGDKVHLSDTAALVAEAAYLQGRYEEAERLTETSERAAIPEDIAPQVVWRSVRAKALARREAFEEAERLGRDAVALVEETDLIDLQGTSRMDLAEVLILAGRAPEAVPLVAEALALYERKENDVMAARARALLSELATGPPAASD